MIKNKEKVGLFASALFVSLCVSANQANNWCELQSDDDPVTIHVPSDMIAGRVSPEISSNALHEWLESGDNRPLLADLRLPIQYQTSHIPGAVPMRAAELSTLAGGARRSIVLIGTGYDGRQLQRYAQRLAVHGHDIHILRGGMAAWALDDQRPLRGPRNLQSLLHIPAEQALLLHQADEWRILSDDNADEVDEIETSHHLLYGGDSPDATAVVSLSLRMEQPVFYVEGGEQAMRMVSQWREKRLAGRRAGPLLAGCRQ